MVRISSHGTSRSLPSQASIWEMTILVRVKESCMCRLRELGIHASPSSPHDKSPGLKVNLQMFWIFCLRWEVEPDWESRAIVVLRLSTLTRCLTFKTGSALLNPHKNGHILNFTLYFRINITWGRLASIKMILIRPPPPRIQYKSTHTLCCINMELLTAQYQQINPQGNWKSRRQTFGIQYFLPNKPPCAIS